MRAHRVATSPNAFTLVEVLVSLTILAMAGAALLLATEGVNASSADALETTVAQGLAESVMADILTRSFAEPGVAVGSTTLGPDAGETSTPVQTRLFDDVDDFHGLRQTPPVDAWGIAVGKGTGSGGTRPTDFQVATDYFAGWSLAVSVKYADESNPAVDLTGNGTSGIKGVTVTLSRTSAGTTKIMAQIRRVVAYVPSSGS